MIISVPGINGLGKTKGCRNAPKEILSSFYINSENVKVIELDNSDIERQEHKIYEESKKIIDYLIKNREKGIFLGGDHSISYPLGKAFIEKSKKGLKNPGLIIFDAHYDLMKPLKNPTHEEWLRALIENKDFKEVLIVGIRRESEKIHEKEKDFANKNSIKDIYS